MWIHRSNRNICFKTIPRRAAYRIGKNVRAEILLSGYRKPERKWHLSQLTVRVSNYFCLRRRSVEDSCGMRERLEPVSGSGDVRKMRKSSRKGGEMLPIRGVEERSGVRPRRFNVPNRVSERERTCFDAHTNETEFTFRLSPVSRRKRRSSLYLTDIRP